MAVNHETKPYVLTCENKEGISFLGANLRIRMLYGGVSGPHKLQKSEVRALMKHGVIVRKVVKPKPSEKSEPLKKSEPKERLEPSKKAEPKGRPEPSEKSEPKERPEPSKKSEPKERPEPSKKGPKVLVKSSVPTRKK